MESILLGALAVAGYNSSKNNKDKKSKKSSYNSKDLDSKYNSNIESNMNKLEKNQANNLITSIKEKKPEFFRQFDELTFDNINEPVSINDAHITITGLNSGLQNNLNLYNGYSNLNDDLNYQVVSKENFTHNNMTPNTSRRDYTIDDSRASRKLEAFTGVNENFVPKQEKYPLFEPMKNLTYVDGMPVFTDYLDDRYLPSNKNNNGNLPFQNNVLIKPGLETNNRVGLGTVYRVTPRSTDALRSETNPKISYLNKPLETIKKGDMRGPDYNLTKYKLPDFRVVNFGDLIPNKATVEAQMKTGKFTNISSQRGEDQTHYSGHANNNNMGDGPSLTKTTFEPTKRQELYNDPTHSINAVNIRPVFTNKESWANRENQRSSLNASQNGNAYLVEGGATNVQFTDIARQTVRESTSHNIITNAKPVYNGPNYQPMDIAKKTIRESTSHNIVINSKPEHNGPNYTPTDIARKTIRESTSHNIVINSKPEHNGPNYTPTDKARETIKETTSHNIILGSNPEGRGPHSQYVDKAKPTIKQTTLYVTPNMNVTSTVVAGYTKDDTDIARKTIKETTETNKYESGPRGIETFEGYTRDLTDEAKKTIRQTTENTQYEGPLHGSDNHLGYTRDVKDEARKTNRQTTENTEYEGPLHGTDNYSGYTRDVNDKARTTTKQTTLLKDYTGALNWGVEKPASHIDSDNMTIRETREISTFNRTAAGGKNITGPQFNKNTLKMNCKKESVYYVSPPSRGLDNNILPSAGEPYNKHTFQNKKPQLTYGNYYTNNIYINTLQENPYVNDIMHQKNYKFDNHSLTN